MGNQNSIICFGEVLWDVLPTGKIAGGAPMNVAFHASNFGLNSKIISSVGEDDLGDELLSFLNKKNINTDLIHINPTYPTSTVQVTLDKKGAANYEIVEPVSWDFLEVDKLEKDAVSNSDLLLFGSLSCRSKTNFKTLLSLIEKAPRTVFDVNLRPPFYSQPLIEDLLQKASIVKMNDDELEEIINWYCKAKNLKERMTFIMKKFNIETLIITAGEEGAYCMHNEKLFAQKSFQVKVKDTVGSGDSFLAAFLYKMLSKAKWQECLEFACATGAFVATQSGGTPIINEILINKFIAENK